MYLRAGCSLAASPKLRPGLFLCLTQTHDNARRGNAVCLLANQSGEAVRRSAMVCAMIFPSVALGNSVNVQGNLRTSIHNARVARDARLSWTRFGSLSQARIATDRLPGAPVSEQTTKAVAQQIRCRLVGQRTAFGA